MKKCFKYIIHGIGLALAFTIIYILSWTPFFILYGISSLMARLLLKIKRIPTNKIVKRNFRRVYPEKTGSEILELCRKYYATFGDYLVEFVKRIHFTNRTMKKRCQFKNLELLKKKFEDHQFVMCYGGHMLNFEWLVSLPLHLPEYGMCHLYLAGEKGRMMDWVLNVRSKYGAINIPTNSPIKPLLQIKKNMNEGIDPHKGYVFGTLADMDTKEANPHTATIFDRKFEVLTGSERIGRKYDMAFVYAHISRPRRGYYVIELREILPPDLETNPYAYTDEFVRMLEANIKEQPELWMQWGECRF